MSLILPALIVLLTLFTGGCSVTDFKDEVVMKVSNESKISVLSPHIFVDGTAAYSGQEVVRNAGSTNIEFNGQIMLTKEPDAPETDGMEALGGLGCVVLLPICLLKSASEALRPVANYEAKCEGSTEFKMDSGHRYSVRVQAPKYSLPVLQVHRLSSPRFMVAEKKLNCSGV